MSEIDLEYLKRWTGSKIEAVDIIDRALVDRFTATFDIEGSYLEGAEAPAGIHWCLAPLLAPTSSLGTDGHPSRGGFLPPVSLPRRMWAGGALRFSGCLRMGDLVARRSRVEDVSLKHGSSGALVFVTVSHEYIVEGATVLREMQDIVYRGLALSEGKADVSYKSHHVAEVSRQHRADAPLLFRYSALTFNTHRIHYDRDYCTEAEAYPGLVVHGPLQATYLLQLAVDQRGWPMHYSFRGRSPLFDGPFAAHGQTVGSDGEFWITDPTGRTTMTAKANWA